MKKIIQHLTIFSREILIISLSLLLLINTFSNYGKQKKFDAQSIEIKNLIKESDSLKVENDSLLTENINMQMELYRHEMTRDEVFLKYPQVKLDYEYFLGHYTE